MVVDVSPVSLLAVLARGGRSWPRGDDPPGAPRRPAAVLAVVSPGRGALLSPTSPPTTPAARRSHPGDELLDPLVHRTERVLAQHRALGLVVQLEVHPVDGEVAPFLLRPADELAAQLGPGGLRRGRLCLQEGAVAGGPRDPSRPPPPGVHAAAPEALAVSHVDPGRPGP